MKKLLMLLLASAALLAGCESDTDPNLTNVWIYENQCTEVITLISTTVAIYENGETRAVRDSIFSILPAEHHLIIYEGRPGTSLGPLDWIANTLSRDSTIVIKGDAQILYRERSIYEINSDPKWIGESDPLYNPDDYQLVEKRGDTTIRKFVFTDTLFEE